MQRGGMQGHQGTAWSHLFDSDSYSGSIMWALVVAKPQSPGTVRVGWRPGPWFLPVLLWTSGTRSSHRVEPGLAGGQTEGSRWFGQSTAGTWNHRPVAFSTARPRWCCPAWGRGEEHRAGKQPSGRSSSLFPAGGPRGHVSSPPPEPLFLSL